MGFLKELDLTNEEILSAENSVPDLVINEINASKDLVIYNINYLKKLGVENFKEVFIKFCSMFLMDASKFESIFNKYDRDDLIEKIKSNVAILEFL